MLSPPHTLLYSHPLCGQVLKWSSRNVHNLHSFPFPISCEGAYSSSRTFSRFKCHLTQEIDAFPSTLLMSREPAMRTDALFKIWQGTVAPRHPLLLWSSFWGFSDRTAVEMLSTLTPRQCIYSTDYIWRCLSRNADLTWTRVVSDRDGQDTCWPFNMSECTLVL